MSASVAELRAHRIAASQLELPPMFLTLILALVVLLIGLSMMIGPVLFQTVPVLAKRLAVVLLATAVFTIDTPLQGDSRSARRGSQRRWPASRIGAEATRTKRSRHHPVAPRQLRPYISRPVGGV
jgi:hypothetical protein